MNEYTEANLIGRIQNIVQVGYTKNEIYGDDVCALDIQQLHAKAKKRVNQTRNPHIMLVHNHKFRAAGLVHILRYWGCRVTMEFTGRKAWLNHLRYNHQSFDCVICDWETDDICGVDLVHYLRGEGSTVCVIALLGPGTTAGVAIRGGANLFLRTPLSIHMHTLKELLLPPTYAASGFPTHLVGTRSKYGELCKVLQDGHRDFSEEVEGLIRDVKSQMELELLSDELLDEVTDAIRTATRQGQSNNAAYIGKLENAMKETLTNAHKAKERMAMALEEVRHLKAQQRECALLHEYHPVRHINQAEIEKLTKMDLKERMLLLEREKMAVNFELEKLENDYAEVTQFQVRLKKGLGDLPIEEGSPDGSQSPTTPGSTVMQNMFSSRRSNGAPATGFGKSLHRSISNLHRSQVKERKQLGDAALGRQKVSIQQRREMKCEALEKMMMEAEDTRSTRNGQVDAVVFRLPWQLQLSGPCKDIYHGVRGVLSQIVDECNIMSVKVLSQFPASQSKIQEFSDKLKDLLGRVAIYDMFKLEGEVVSPMKGTSLQLKHDKSDRIDWKMQRQALIIRSARLLGSKNDACLAQRVFDLWKQFTAKRLTYFAVGGDQSIVLHQMDRYQMASEMEKRKVSMKEIAEARKERDGYAKELRFAKETITELRAQISILEAQQITFSSDALPSPPSLMSSPLAHGGADRGNSNSNSASQSRRGSQSLQGVSFASSSIRPRDMELNW